MFIGHALLAFAVAALVAERRGWDNRRALLVGVVAGTFATIPDVDVAYALVGLLEWRPADGVLAAPVAFWDASRAVHRSVTHSLVVGAIAAPAFGFLSGRASDRSRLATAAAVGLLSLLAAIALLDGLLAAFVMGLFVASGALVAILVGRRTALSPTTVALAALWGLWSHPWGDLVTGSPPDVLYPLDWTLLPSRIVLHGDPTLHLLGAFAIELAAVLLGLVAICRLTDRPILASVDRRAAAGAAYGLVALTTTPPTLEVSYHFVFPILGVGLLCGWIRSTPSTDRGRQDSRLETLLAIALTSLAAVTVALVAYAAVYLLLVAPT